MQIARLALAQILKIHLKVVLDTRIYAYHFALYAARRLCCCIFFINCVHLFLSNIL